MSQGLCIYNTLLLPCGRSWLLQRCGRVLACFSSDLGLIPGWGRSNIFALGQWRPMKITHPMTVLCINISLGLISRDS